MKSIAGRLVCLLLFIAPAARAQDDTAGVRRAALDYIEGFYEGDSTKLVRSVHPTVTKFGYYIPRGQEAYTGEPMSYQAMMDFANAVAANPARKARPDAPKEVTIYEVQDQTASAKVVAWWGTDYLLLGKYDGKWMIVHVLWQSPPRG
ncbi:MAG: nuclear transport factor 2 family protein [Rhodothermales bacterium]